MDKALLARYNSTRSMVDKAIALRFRLAVSLDGVTKKTVESIRANGNYELGRALHRGADRKNERNTPQSLVVIA